MPVEAETVWMVPLGPGAAEEVEGSLSLEAHHLVFRTAEGSLERRIDLTAIRRVRRILGSPVLVVELEEPTGPARMAFYFVRPPPLETAGTMPPRVRPRRMRRKNVVYLGVENRMRKKILRSWVRAIREARRAASPS